MEIPLDVLDELKCSVCENYLSRGPVYLQQDGAAVCSVCFSPKRPATRNKQYEATATLLLFPCKNQDLGCEVKVPFVKEAESSSHEEVCEHRQYVCPVLGSALCDWVGTRRDILKHCEEQHADKVKENPTSLTHDISKSSEQTYLLCAFQLMFLLHVKVCVTAGKIYHAVRYLGRSDEAKNFTFNLDIKRNNEQISKKGFVVQQGCLSIQIDTSLGMNTNSLLDMLGGYDNTMFTITVERIASAIEQCAKCNLYVTTAEHRNESGWLCKRCVPIKQVCINNGCDYMDIPIKCNKHYSHFCPMAVYCNICDQNISRNSLFTHYESAHKNITYNAGSTWRVTWTESNTESHCRLVSVAGNGMCRYCLDDTKFKLEIFIPVLTTELHKFNCLIRITQTATGRVRTFTPNTIYKKTSDWCIIVTKSDFPMWSLDFDVCVNITKRE